MSSVHKYYARAEAK